MDVLLDTQIELNANKSLRYISEHCNISVIPIPNISTEPKLSSLGVCST